MSTPQPELTGVLSDWFHCPRCGDDGETRQTVFADIGTLRFVCQNPEHTPGGDEERRFRASDATEDASRSLTSRLGLTRADGRLGDTRACLWCPTCESSYTDGALEWVVVGLEGGDTDERLRVFVATVWCEDCEAVARSSLARDGRSSVLPSDAVAAGSEYPPVYIR